jgi:REP element-mobilizing transposase RayT
MPLRTLFSIAPLDFHIRSKLAHQHNFRNWHFHRWLENPATQTIVEETWKALPTRFQGVALDDFVIMPDHIHLIIWINAQIKRSPSLSKIIDTYKSLTSVHWLRLMKGRGQAHPGLWWQRNYFEHIVRDKFELEQARLYVRNNPIRWVLRHGETGFHGKVIPGDGRIPL